MFMRIYHKRMGGHVHMRVFVGKGRNVALSKAGDLRMTTEEFKDWQRHIERYGIVEFCFEAPYGESEGDTR